MWSLWTRLPYWTGFPALSGLAVNSWSALRPALSLCSSRTRRPHVAVQPSRSCLPLWTLSASQTGPSLQALWTWNTSGALGSSLAYRADLSLWASIANWTGYALDTLRTRRANRTLHALVPAAPQREQEQQREQKGQYQYP